MGVQPNSNFYFQRFFALKPIMICSRENCIGQQISFYQHPSLGDTLPVFVTIRDPETNQVSLFQSNFFDVDQMIPGDIHEPVMSDGLMWIKYDLALI